MCKECCRQAAGNYRLAACAPQTTAMAVLRPCFTPPKFYTGGMKFCRGLFCFLVFCLFTDCLQAAASEKTIALKAARLFDGKSKTLITNGVVIVQGNKIVDAGSNVPVPSDAQLIDLGDATLSPGFMDGHTHLTTDFSKFNVRRLDELDLNASEQV